MAKLRAMRKGVKMFILFNNRKNIRKVHISFESIYGVAEMLKMMGLN